MRYVLHPGHIYSRFDGDRHFISAAALVECYGLRYQDVPWVTCDPLYVPADGDTHLHARADGDYTLPERYP